MTVLPSFRDFFFTIISWKGSRNIQKKKKNWHIYLFVFSFFFFSFRVVCHIAISRPPSLPTSLLHDVQDLHYIIWNIHKKERRSFRERETERSVQRHRCITVPILFPFSFFASFLPCPVPPILSAVLNINRTGASSFGFYVCVGAAPHTLSE